jgi:hypothetical protein
MPCPMEEHSLYFTGLGVSYWHGWALLSLLSIVCGIVAHTIVISMVRAGESDVRFKHSLLVRCGACIAIAAALNLSPLIFSYSQPTGRIVAGAFLAWWGTFKVFAAFMGRSELLWSKSWLQTTVLLACPVVLKRGVVSTPMSMSEVLAPIDGGSEFVLAASKLMAVIGLLHIHGDATYRFELVPVEYQNHIILAALLYLALSLLMDFPASLIDLLGGVQLTKHFDEPYLSVSIRDFWSNRWNLTAGLLLRNAVYDPVIDALRKDSVMLSPRATFAHAPQKPSYVSKTLASMSAFAVSGMAHELILWFVGCAGTWYWYYFFQVQALLIVAEAVLLPSKHYTWCRTSRVYAICSRILTFVVFFAIAECLFWPPVEQCGLVNRVIDEWVRMFHKAHVM